MLIPAIVAIVLTMLTVVRGAWPLAVVAWACFGLAAIIGSGIATLFVLMGAVCLILGGLSITRGAIFDGSPKAVLSERRPSLFRGENYEGEPDMDSVNFTHRFWGP